VGLLDPSPVVIVVTRNAFEHVPVLIPTPVARLGNADIGSYPIPVEAK
jgi:hypothetical protein